MALSAKISITLPSNKKILATTTSIKFKSFLSSNIFVIFEFMLKILPL